MATNNRDVELGISVVTAGSEGIKRLKDEVQALAKQGGAAAPEFNALADELDRLGAQAAALESFDKLARDVRDLGAAQGVAAKASQEMSVELAAVSQRADEFRAKQAAALTELRESQKSLTNARIALAEYKNSLEAADASTEVYQARVRSLSATVIDARKAITDNAAAYRDAKQATREAEVEETKLENAYRRSVTEMRNATAALAAKEAAQREASGTLRALGVDTDNLAQAEVRLVQALQDSKTKMESITETQRQAIELAKAQAREEERLAAIVANTKREMAAAAQVQLQSELRAYDEMVAAQRRAADQAKQTASAIQNALGTVGVKSANELRDEIANVRNSLLLLKESGTLTGRELDAAMGVGQKRIKELERDLREATGTMTTMDKVSKGLNTTMAQFAGAITLVEVVQRLARGFFDATKQIETLRLALGQVYGSTQIAATQIEFLRNTANRAGIGIGAISDAFVKFSASTKAANIGMDQTNALFAAVSQAAGTLGLSGDKVNHILEALAQTAAKGQVSLEELRGQLGDSLPGAMSLAAKGLGITDAQLIKLVESGGLLARDLFPALTKSLTAMGGEVNTVSGAWERLKNATTVTFQAIGDAGGIVVLTEALKGAKAALDIFGMGLVTVLNTIRLTFEGTGTFIGVLVGSGSLSEALKAAGEKTDEATQRMNAYRETMFGAGDAAQTMNAKLLEANRGTEAQYQTTLKSIGVLQQQTQSMISTGVATEAAGLQAKLAGDNWVQLSIKMQENREKAENAIVVAENLGKAKVQEAANTAELVKMTGNEVDAREAAAEAAQKSAVALESVALAREKALAQQIAFRGALIEEVKRLGDADGARMKSIEAINERIAKLASETERSRQAADEARNNALALQIESAAMKDNSGRLAELTSARSAAILVLQATIDLEKIGAATKEQVAQAQERVIYFERLYQDALRDTLDKLNAKITLLRAEAALKQSSFDLERAELEVILAKARAMGDSNKVRETTIKLKQLEITVARAKVEAIKLEAQAEIEAAGASARELEATGKLTDAKRLEITARIENAKAKLTEANAGAERLKILEDELKRMKELGTTAQTTGQQIQQGFAGATGAIATHNDAMERLMMNYKLSADYTTRQIQLLEEEAAAAEKAAEAKRKYWNVDKDGFSLDNNGQRQMQSVPNQRYVYDTAKSQGLTDQQAIELVDRFIRNGEGVGMANGMDWFSSVNQAISEIVLQEARKRAAGETTGGTTGGGAGGGTTIPTTSPTGPAITTPTPARTPRNVGGGISASTGTTPGGTRTIRFDFGNGFAPDVTVASAADAANLESVVSKLATMKGASL